MFCLIVLNYVLQFLAILSEWHTIKNTIFFLFDKAIYIIPLTLVQSLYVIILSIPNKYRYVFNKKMLLVKTSFFFVFMPYICDPFTVKPEVR
jgi:hypothetical protein